MLRQTINCDVCGTVKQDTNHWFVAYDQGGEFRVKGWNPSDPLYAGAKHLCGQNCLFKLLEEFLARYTQPADEDIAVTTEQIPRAVATCAVSMNSAVSHTSPVVDIEEYESSIGLVAPPEAPVKSPTFHKPRRSAAR